MMLPPLVARMRLLQYVLFVPGNIIVHFCVQLNPRKRRLSVDSDKPTVKVEVVLSDDDDVSYDFQLVLEPHS